MTGIVLAGGRSSRFGRDKLREWHRGRPLLHHPIEAMAEVCSEILVVSAPEAGALDLPRDVVTPLRVVRDVEPFAGPLAGLAAGLTETDTPLALVTGGDMPELAPAVLVQLVLVASEEGVAAAALAVAGEVRPLPCALRTQALATAQALLARGERSLRALLDELDAREVPDETWRALDPSGGTLRDVDTPDDLDV